MTTSNLLVTYLGYGTAASRPAAPAAGSALALWFATDTLALSAWTGAAWVAVNPGQAPSTADHAGSPYAVAAGASIVYHADPTAGTITFTLPASPTLWQKFVAKDTSGQSGTNAITIAGNGNNIEGSASLTMGFAYGWVSLQWNGTQWVQMP